MKQILHQNECIDLSSARSSCITAAPFNVVPEIECSPNVVPAGRKNAKNVRNFGGLSRSEDRCSIQLSYGCKYL